VLNKRLIVTVGAILVLMPMAIGRSMAEDKIDRSASLRFAWSGAPANYDPPFSKNQYSDMPYMFPVYDSLIRLGAKGTVVPDLATSWTFSPDGRMLTMTLRKGVKFTDGSDLTADAVVRSLTRAIKDPASMMAKLLSSLESVEAKDPSTVILHLNTPDANVLFPLATSAGMIVSAKALDSGVNLALNPVGSGPYKLVSSGPQGANFERNEGYFDKSQNQFAKLALLQITDTNARLNALQSGQVDAGLFQADQWPQIQGMVQTGNFTVHSFVEPNSLPLFFNTKVKPFDDKRVRMALNLAVNRTVINDSIMKGQCPPASQPLQPGVVGHDENLKVYKQDLEKAKALLQEAGVGSLTFDAIVSISEPVASIGLAIQDQLRAIGVTMNIIPTSNNLIRPLFRGGKHPAMVYQLVVPAPDPASLIDAVYLSPDNPGGVTPEFAKAVADARTKPIGSPDRETAYKAISKMAYEDPHHVFICWAPQMIVARKGIVGIEKTAYIDAAPIPDVRGYGMVAK